MEGRKISQKTLVEHILLKHFQLLVVLPLVRWCVPDCHVMVFRNRGQKTTVIKKGTTNVKSIFKLLER